MQMALLTKIRQWTRPWLRFSLSSLLILVLIVSLPLAWQARQRQFERERRLALAAAASVSPHVTSGRTREIFVALEKIVDLSVKDVPLEQLMVSLGKEHGIPIEFDRRACDELGIDPRVAITRTFKDLRLVIVLRWILKELDLTFIVQDDYLLITTKRRAAEIYPCTRAYNVADLLGSDGTAEELAQTLRSVFPPGRPLETDDGFPIHFSAYQHLLLVRTTHEGHHWEVVKTLSMIRAGMNPESKVNDFNFDY